MIRRPHTPEPWEALDWLAAALIVLVVVAVLAGVRG
jgi:hypothetical protein